MSPVPRSFTPALYFQHLHPWDTHTDSDKKEWQQLIPASKSAVEHPRHRVLHKTSWELQQSPFRSRIENNMRITCCQEACCQERMSGFTPSWKLPVLEGCFCLISHCYYHYHRQWNVIYLAGLICAVNVHSKETCLELSFIVRDYCGCHCIQVLSRPVLSSMYRSRLKLDIHNHIISQSVGEAGQPPERRRSSAAWIAVYPGRPHQPSVHGADPEH